MAEVVVIGAGLSGTLMAYELLPQVAERRPPDCHFPGAGVSFRPLQSLGRGRLAQRSDIEIDLVDIMKRKGIRLLTQGAQRVQPDGKPRRTWGRHFDRLRLSGHRHRSGARLRRDSGPRPDGHTQSICHVDHASRRQGRRSKSLPQSGSGRDRRSARRFLLWPGLRIPVHPGNRAATPQASRPRTDDLRYLRTLYRPSRARRGRRHQGPARKRDAREAHQMDHQRPRQKCRTGQDVGRGGRGRRFGPQDPRTAVRLFDDAAGVPRRRRRSRHREAHQPARLRHRR